MKSRSNILKLALFATGLSGIVAEYTLSTLATYFLGDSVLQWTMTVSIMLFSMGLGSRLSKYFQKNLLEKFISIEFILSLMTSFVSVITYMVSAYYGFSGIIIYALCILVGLLIGMEIPLVIRLNDEYESLRVNVSSAMEKDYYGSLLGGVFFAFIGLPYLGLTYTPFVLGSVNFLVALSLIGVLWKSLGQKLKKKLIIQGLGIATLLIAGVISAKTIIEFGETLRYKDQIVYSQQSKYQRIVITQSKEDFWLFINGNQQLSSLDETMYHEPLVHPALSLSKNPSRVLVLGGGDGGAIREILKYQGVKKVDLVDLDPAMTNLGKTHPLLTEMNQRAFENSKVTIFNEDGYQFIENNKDYYDVIIVDLPDPKTIEISRLYSYEFYKLCYKKLRPHGILITQAGSPYYAAEAFNCIRITMDEAGFSTAPLHNHVVTLGEWGWILGKKNTDSATLKENLQHLTFKGIKTRWVNQDAMTLMTSFGKKVFIGDQDSVEVNSIHNPVLYKYYLGGHWDLY